MAKVGMDAGIVRADAAQMDQIANQLHALVGSINGSVGRMSSGWFGPDAEQLINRWQRQSRPAIEALAVQVHQLADKARNEAHGQDAASSVIGPGAHHLLVDAGSLLGLVGGAAGASALASLTRGFVNSFPGAVLDFARHGKSWDSSGSVHAEVNRNAHGSTSVGGVPVSGDVSARAYADADYSAHAGVSRHGAEAAAAASVGVGVAVAANGKIGNDFASASGHVGASAEAKASADVKASIGADGAKVHAGAKAYAGVQADASAHGEVGGVGGTAGVTGYAGVGVQADIDAKVTIHEVKASVHLGAALGLGAGVSFSVDVQPDKVLDNISHIHLW